MQVNYKAGQSLLVIVLLIAVVFTLIASASYRLTTETQSAKIQEETVRTLAAADSGIEKGLQQLDSLTIGVDYTFSTSAINISLPGIDAANSTVTVNTAAGQFFASPLVEKDSQYTFYLYDYPSGATYYSNILQLSFGPQVAVASGCGAGRSIPALEVTRIFSNNTVARNIIEPCTTNPSIQSTGGTKAAVFGAHTINGLNFGYRADFTAAEMTNVRLLIVRAQFTSTFLGFNTGAPARTFPIQGRTITSEAVSTTGISKIVTLFRSNPQIPSDFFVTSF